MNLQDILLEAVCMLHLKDLDNISFESYSRTNMYYNSTQWAYLKINRGIKYLINTVKKTLCVKLIFKDFKK